MSEAVCGTAAVTSPVVAGVGGGGPETRVLLLDPVATRPRGTGRLTGLGGGGPAGGPLVPNGAEASAPELGDSVDSSVGAEVAFALALALDLPAALIRERSAERLARALMATRQQGFRAKLTLYCRAE